MPVAVRAATAEDWPFIISTWLRTYQRSGPYAGLVHRTVYFRNHHAVVEAIISRRTTRALVATDPVAPDLLYGYIVLEVGRLDRDIIHYVYVKEPWQRLGIATELIGNSGLDPAHCYISHYTKTRSDLNPDSPRYGEVRFPGAEVFGQRWPLAKDVPVNESNPRSKRVFRDGPLFNPYAA
jgi:hypothetical protein